MRCVRPRCPGSARCGVQVAERVERGGELLGLGPAGGEAQWWSAIVVDEPVGDGEESGADRAGNDQLVVKWLLRHRRFHFTPTYGSWMNLVERLVPCVDHEETATLLAQQRGRTRRRHQQLGEHPERELEAIRLAQDRRPDTRTPRRLQRRDHHKQIK